MTFRGALYFLARLLGDANAIQRGPQAVVERVARKTLWRAAGGIINAMIKGKP